MEILVQRDILQFGIISAIHFLNHLLHLLCIQPSFHKVCKDVDTQELRKADDDNRTKRRQERWRRSQLKNALPRLKVDEDGIHLLQRANHYGNVEQLMTVEKMVTQTRPQLLGKLASEEKSAAGEPDHLLNVERNAVVAFVIVSVAS